MSSSSQVPLTTDAISYLDQLTLVPKQAPGVPMPQSVAMMIKLSGDPSGTLTNQFLDQYSLAKPLPQTTEAFLSAYVNYLKAKQLPNVPDPTVTAPFDNIVLDYAANVNNYAVVHGLDGGSPTQNDWSAIPTNLSTLRGQASNWFTHILQTYDYHPTIATPNGKVGTVNEFFNQAGKEMTIIAGISNGNQLLTHPAVGQYVPIGVQVPTYQQVYEFLFPTGATPPNPSFAKRMQAFVQEQIGQNGYFIPSQSFAAFVHEIESDYIDSLKLNGNFFTPATSLDSADFKQTQILNRIFALLATMLDSLQKIAIAQSGRLFVYTQWQQSYTNLLAQMPTFLKSGTPITYLTELPPPANLPDPNPEKATQRTELNTKTGTLRDVVTNYRNLVSDESKSMQADLNKSTDAQAQQANMATAFLQELSSLLSALYR